MMREHLTPEGGEELLRAASGKSKRELQHLLAERFPRPDAASRIRALGAEPIALPAMGPPLAATATPSTHHPRRSRIEPLAPAKYRVEFTASEELEEKLRRAADLMRHSNPSGELSVLVERALDLLLAKLEKQRHARTTRAVGETPRPSTRRGYVSRAVRREVFGRDGERCTFGDECGRRCESRTWLELDHRIPRARGGADDAWNLTVRCRAHNRLSAEQQFGRDHMDRWTGRRRRRGQGIDNDIARRGPAVSSRAPEISTGASQSERDERERTNHPRQRGYDDPVFRALCGMRFQAREARRACAIVSQRRAGSPPGSIESMLREALAALT
jgi:5-methylcytosine-specific restriction endonuclease McrA